MLYLLFPLLAVFTAFAAESPSFVLQDNLPNYGQNGQHSGDYSLYGDTTWHEQPFASPSYQLTINQGVSSSASSSSVNNGQNNTANQNNQEGGLREESLANKTSSSQSSILPPPFSSQSSSEALAFAPNEPNIRLYVGGESSSPLKPSHGSATESTTSSSTEAIDSESTSSQQIVPCTEPTHSAATPVTVVNAEYTLKHFKPSWHNRCIHLLFVFIFTLLTAVCILQERKIRGLRHSIEALTAPTKKKRATKKSTVKKSTVRTKR